MPRRAHQRLAPRERRLDVSEREVRIADRKQDVRAAKLFPVVDQGRPHRQRRASAAIQDDRIVREPGHAGTEIAEPHRRGSAPVRDMKTHRGRGLERVRRHIPVERRRGHEPSLDRDRLSFRLQQHDAGDSRIPCHPVHRVAGPGRRRGQKAAAHVAVARAERHVPSRAARQQRIERRLVPSSASGIDRAHLVDHGVIRRQRHRPQAGLGQRGNRTPPIRQSHLPPMFDEGQAVLEDDHDPRLQSRLHRRTPRERHRAGDDAEKQSGKTVSHGRHDAPARPTLVYKRRKTESTSAERSARPRARSPIRGRGGLLADRGGEP